MVNTVKRVSVVIPVYNGADTIGELCHRLIHSFEGRYAL